MGEVFVESRDLFIASIKPRIEIRGNPAGKAGRGECHLIASIKPRIEIRGNANPGDRPGGAPLASIKPRIEIRGNSPIARITAENAFGFNKAANRNSRKFAQLMADRKAINASIKPRIEIRGNTPSGRAASIARMSFNKAANRNSRKSQAAPTVWGLFLLASIKPRIEIRGNTPQRAPKQGRPKSFNKAANRNSRKFVPVVLGALGWVASFNKAANRNSRKCHDRLHAHFPAFLASIKPRIEIRGNGSRRGERGRADRASIKPRIEIRGNFYAQG